VGKGREGKGAGREREGGEWRGRSDRYERKCEEKEGWVSFPFLGKVPLVRESRLEDYSSTNGGWNSERVLKIKE